ncbi:MAG: ATP-binding protein [Dehalococcoidia bacterium]|nr:ATP-binding protein [Dehalococcoidia bacterium]
MTFTPRSDLRSIADLRISWTLGAVEPGSDVTIDLSKWRQAAPSVLVGLIAAIGKLARHGCRITIKRPNNRYALRLLDTAGWRDALGTFGEWEWHSDLGPPIRRILPLLPIHNFKTFTDVENLVGSLETEFLKSGKLPGNLLQDVSLVLAEAADNVIWHANCPEGGFALAQVRQRQIFGEDHWFVEVAVADAGRGISASLGKTDDREAISLAFEEGVTGTDAPTRGYGLAEIRATALSGPERLVTIHSGHGLVAKGFGYDLSREVTARFDGTLVAVEIPVKFR